MVAAAVRPRFGQPDRPTAQRQVREVCTTLRVRFPQAVALREAADEKIFPCCDLPLEYRGPIGSTNPLMSSNLVGSPHTALGRQSGYVPRLLAG